MQEMGQTTLISGGDFTPDDDRDWPDFTIEIAWRARKGKTKGVEQFTASGEPHPGILFAVESGDPRAASNLLVAALLDDDGEAGDNGEQIPGTSSAERFNRLVFDRERQIPAAAIRKVLQGLYNEYVNRNRPSAAAEVPTGRPGQSSNGSSTTGRTSRARRNGRASTSAAVIPAEQ